MKRIIIFIIYIITSCTYDADMGHLYKIEVNERNGFINEFGKEVIPAEYLYATDFEDGIALVVTDTLFTNDYKEFRLKYNYINKRNKKIFTEDFTVKPGFTLFILQDDREEVAKYISKYSFSCGLALNQLQDTENLYGYIDINGNIVIPHQYSDGLPYSENKTFVQQSTNDMLENLINNQGSISLFEYDSKWKIIDKFNNNLTDYIFVDTPERPIIPYRNNRTIGFIVTDNGGELKCTANLLDENANIIKVIPSIGDEFSALMTSIGLESLDNSWSIGLEFSLSDSVIVQYSGALSGFGMDSRFLNPFDGSEIPIYENLSHTQKTAIRSRPDFLCPTNDGNHRIYISHSKEFSEGLIPCAYTNFNEDLGPIGASKWFYVNENKCIIGIEPNDIFQDALPFSSGLAAVKQNGKWGYINKEFKTVIPYQYDIADSFNGNLAKVETRNGSLQIVSYINKDGEVVWQDIAYSDPQMFSGKN